MKKLLAFFGKHPRLLLAFNGALTALPHCFPILFIIPFFSLIPCTHTLFNRKNKKFKTLWCDGFCFFFLYNAVIYLFFLWMYPLESAGFTPFLSALTVIAAWLGISAVQGAVMAFVFPLFSITVRKLKPGLIYAAVFGFLWVLTEFLMEQGALGFPWNRLSMSMYLFTPFIQSASLFSSLFTSFITVVTAAALALFVSCRRKLFALTALIIFSINLLYGIIAPLCTPQSEDLLSITVVQGNILSGEKWESDRLQHIYDTYTSLTYEAEPSDLIIWPETAVPINISENTYMIDYYANLSKSINAPLLMGAVTSSDEGNQQNSVVAIDENGIISAYNKRHLVPFGEYLPRRNILGAVFPFLAQINMLSDDLQAGNDSDIITVNGVEIGALVCFDSAFASLARDAVSDGARLIVLATNDSWYKDSAATTQHLAQSVFRAVENGRSVAVAANSGISAFITCQGQVTSVLEPLTEGTLTEYVDINKHTTLYTLLGEAPLLTVCALGCILPRPALFFYNKRKEK